MLIRDGDLITDFVLIKRGKIVTDSEATDEATEQRTKARSRSRKSRSTPSNNVSAF